MSTEVRRIIWPRILGIKTETIFTGRSLTCLFEVQSLIKKDAKRTLAFQNGRTNEEVNILENQLESLLTLLLNKNPDFQYYQGLNDVAGNLLLIFNPSLALLIMEKICHLYLQYLLYIFQSFKRISYIILISS